MNSYAARRAAAALDNAAATAVEKPGMAGFLPPARLLTNGDDGMMLLVTGLAVFFAAHIIPTQPDLRASFIARLGEGTYKIVFSLVSLAGLALIVFGWSKLGLHPGKNPILWEPPLWTRHIAITLMLPATVLLVAAYVPSRIRTAVKHPMLAAIKIWALAHLIANGDLASVLLFGSFLAYGVYDRISVKRRGALGPLGATAGGMGGDALAAGLGLALYVVFLLWGHEFLIGKPPLGGV